MKQHGTKALLLLLLLALIWGSSFILMKKGLMGFSPLQMASLRLTIAALVLLPWAVKGIKYSNKKDYIYFLVAGWIGSGIPAFLFAMAQTHVSSAISGALNALTPVFTLIIGALVFKNKPGFLKIFGILIGFSGALWLILRKANGDFEFNYGYGMLIVLATLCYGISTNTIRYKLSNVPSIAVAAIGLLTCAVPAIVILLTTHTPTLIYQSTAAQQALGYIVILATLGSALALVIFNYLIKTTDTLFSASVTYLMPIVALMWGSADNEKIKIGQLIGVGCILIGIWLVNYSPPTKTTKESR